MLRVSIGRLKNNGKTAVCLMLPGAAFAHDASKHKGGKLYGEVLSVTKDRACA